MNSTFHLKNYLSISLANAKIDEHNEKWHRRTLVVADRFRRVAEQNHESLQLQKCYATSISTAWHYTIGAHFLSIMDSGILLPYDPKKTLSEYPVLWFSLNQEWEPTACKGAVKRGGKYATLSKYATRELGCGPARFGFPTALLRNWAQLRKAAKFKTRHSNALEKVGYDQDTIPAQWMGSLQKIAVSDLMIEFWDGQKWNCIQDPSTGDSWAWRTVMQEAA